MTFQDGFILFFFVLVSIGALQVLRAGLGQWLRWDVGEREKVLQQQMRVLQDELERAQEKVSTLEKQIRILLTQYEDAIVRLNSLKEQYTMAVQDAQDVREELEKVRNEMPLSTYAGSGRLLIVAIGSEDSGLEMDLASLRAVRVQTGLEFERILNATPERLKNSLDRARLRRMQTYLHLSVQSGPEGYRLGDRVVDATSLSESLDGVIVMLVAGPESDWIGDFLGVVPYVITISEQISNRDAASFTRLFWSEIGKGLGPTLALQRALQRSPSGMREYVIPHWGGE